MHFAFQIFAILVILILGWLLFVAWVFGIVFRALWNVFSRITGLGKHSRVTAFNPRRCARFRCGAANPAPANYCRRCGAPLTHSAAMRQPFNTIASRRWASSPISL